MKLGLIHKIAIISLITLILVVGVFAILFPPQNIVDIRLSSHPITDTYTEEYQSSHAISFLLNLTGTGHIVINLERNGTNVIHVNTWVEDEYKLIIPPALVNGTSLLSVTGTNLNYTVTFNELFWHNQNQFNVTNITTTDNTTNVFFEAFYSEDRMDWWSDVDITYNNSYQQGVCFSDADIHDYIITITGLEPYWNRHYYNIEHTALINETWMEGILVE